MSDYELRLVRWLELNGLDSTRLRLAIELGQSIAELERVFVQDGGRFKRVTPTGVPGDRAPQGALSFSAAPGGELSL